MKNVRNLDGNKVGAPVPIWSTNLGKVSKFSEGPKDGWRAREAQDIMMKLQQVEVLQSKGLRIQQAVFQIGVTKQTYYRWLRQYASMSRDQLNRLKYLENENAQLRRAVQGLNQDGRRNGP